MLICYGWPRILLCRKNISKAVGSKGLKSISLNQMAPTIKAGKYHHYKGHEYEVIGIAKHSETLEDMVVYRALYGDGGLWVRPLSMFGEMVEVDGRQVPRFEYVGE